MTTRTRHHRSVPRLFSIHRCQRSISRHTGPSDEPLAISFWGKEDKITVSQRPRPGPLGTTVVARDAPLPGG